MQAGIFCVTFPVIGLLIWLGWRENKPAGGRELLCRYAMYALLTNLIVALVMVVLCDEGTSLQTKLDASPVFLVKFAFLELVSVLLVAAAEWLYVTRKITIRIKWQEYREMGLCRFVEKILLPGGIYLTAAGVALLNVSLMFDNVLWGDECFSANTAQKSVDGILQVLYFWDNHPPLYYYWLKLFGDLFGHRGEVYHLASLIPFFMGILLALVFLRRRFGNIPAAFFVIITGLAAPCLQYNLEIRMYSLAFLGVACCYYCAYRVLCGGKIAWLGMVFWALVGAYSHYYAMMTVGIMIFITGVAAAIRLKKKTWIKSVLALFFYVLGYAPWLGFLFHAANDVSKSWWITEIMSLRDSLQMVLCGTGFSKIIFCLGVLFLAVLLLSESSLFRVRRQGTQTQITVCRPRLKGWSDETYAAAVGILTIAGTLIAAYVLCLIIGPVLAQRYLYPLSAVTALFLVIGAGGILNLSGKLGENLKKKWLKKAAKCLLAAVLVILCIIGAGNYSSYRSQTKKEQAVTEQTLALIGEVPESTALVSNNVKHLSWTVLYYYYPHRDIITGTYNDIDGTYRDFWYFTPVQMDSGEVKEMTSKGYQIAYYGTQQIATYSFELYYFEKTD